MKTYWPKLLSGLSLMGLAGCIPYRTNSNVSSQTALPTPGSSIMELQASFKEQRTNPTDQLKKTADLINSDSEKPYKAVLETLSARSLQLSLKQGLSYDEALPLSGIPIATKANLAVRGLPNTAASKVFEIQNASKDAFLIDRLRKKGALFFPITNMFEFAIWQTTTSGLGGTTKHAHSLNHHAGGSSGGTAVAVKRGYVPAGLGSDTCGSIQIPSALNGVFGLRPTVPQGDEPANRSLEGVFPLAPSMDAIGPIARAPFDLALVFDALYERQTTAQLLAIDETSKPHLKVLVLKSTEPTHTAAQAEVSAFLKRLQLAADLDLVEADINEKISVFSSISAVCKAIVADEFYRQGAYANHVKHEQINGAPSFDDLIDDPRVAPTTKKVLEMVKSSPPLLSRRWINLRPQFQQTFAEFFNKDGFDLVIYPTMTSPPAPILTASGEANELQTGYEYTLISPLTGLPTITVPNSDQSDPLLNLGVSLLANYGREDLLLEVAERVYRQSHR